MADGKYTVKIMADPEPTIEMFRELAACHRENAAQMDLMCERLEALWAKQNEDPAKEQGK